MILTDIVRRFTDFLKVNPVEPKRKPDIVESYLGYLDRFDTEVLPLIRSGEYRGAADEIEGILTYLGELRFRDWVDSKLDSGLNYLLCCRQLANSMGEGNKPPEFLIESVIAHGKQIRMKIKSLKSK